MYVCHITIEITKYIYKFVQQKSRNLLGYDIIIFLIYSYSKKIYKHSNKYSLLGNLNIFMIIFIFQKD